MKIAVPVRAGSLTNRLDTVDELSLVEVDLEARRILSAQRALVRIAGSRQLVECLGERGVGLLIAAGATDDDRLALEVAGIELRAGVAGRSARKLVKEVLSDPDRAPR